MQNKAVKYKNKRKVTEELGFYAVYMDRRRTHLYCKFPLFWYKNGKRIRNQEQTIEKQRILTRERKFWSEKKGENGG